MTRNLDYLVHTTFFGKGSSEYNFEIDVMKDSSDLLILIAQAKECYDGISNGAVLLVTEKQYIMAFNRGMGRGAHDSTFARLYADLTDKAELSLMNVKKYCMKAEEKFLLAKFYSEKETEFSPVVNIVSFSFYRKERVISEKEFASFMEFYDEYAWAIKKYGFKVSFCGIDMTLEEVKERLESMVDKNFYLSSVFPDEEPIIGTPTTDGDMLQK